MKRLSPFVIVVVFSVFLAFSKVCGEDHKGIFLPLQYATGFKVEYLGNGCKLYITHYLIAQSEASCSFGCSQARSFDTTASRRLWMS